MTQRDESDIGRVIVHRRRRSRYRIVGEAWGGRVLAQKITGPAYTGPPLYLRLKPKVLERDWQ